MNRWVRRVLLCVAAGAAVNVLVAWVLLVSSPHAPFAIPFADQPNKTGVWPIAAPSEWPQEWRSRYRFVTQLGNEVEVFEKTRYSAYGQSVGMRVVRCGWPRRSLMRVEFQGMTDVEAAGESQVSRWFREGVELPAWAKRQIANQTAWWLPVRPIWDGFAVNTGLFGGVAGSAWGLCAAARRRRRGLAGRCIACGYELAGLSRCPECGATTA